MSATSEVSCVARIHSFVGRREGLYREAARLVTDTRNSNSFNGFDGTSIEMPRNVDGHVSLGHHTLNTHGVSGVSRLLSETERVNLRQYCTERSNRN